jgi:hypothetical protein
MQAVDPVSNICSSPVSRLLTRQDEGGGGALKETARSGGSAPARAEAGAGHKIATADDLQAATLERCALEEIGEVARRWVPKLKDSPVRTELNRLQDLAPPRPETHPRRRRAA